MASVARVVWILFLGIAGLLGLSMSLCGGGFAVGMLRSGGNVVGAMILPLLSLAAGISICVGVAYGFRRAWKAREASSDRPV